MEQSNSSFRSPLSNLSRSPYLSFFFIFISEKQKHKNKKRKAQGNAPKNHQERWTTY